MPVRQVVAGYLPVIIIAYACGWWSHHRAAGQTYRAGWLDSRRADIIERVQLRTAIATELPGTVAGRQAAIIANATAGATHFATGRTRVPGRHHQTDTAILPAVVE